MLKTNYADCFAQATIDVLGTYLDKPATKGSCTEPEEGSALKDVAVIIGITGQMEGRLLMEFAESTALSICEAMNFGEPFDTLDRMARATLCELANLVAGRAVTLLNEEGSKFSITPPIILCGVGMKASGILVPAIIPVDTERGTLIVNLAVKEVQN